MTRPQLERSAPRRPANVGGAAIDRPAPRAGGAAAPLLPALVFTIIVTQIPFLLTLFYSLQSLEPRPAGVAGVRVVRRTTSTSSPTSQFRQVALNTVVMTLGSVLVAVVLGLVLALLLNRQFVGRGVVRTLLITPFLIMPVAAALLWRRRCSTRRSAWSTSCSRRSGLGHRLDRRVPAGLASMAALVWQWTPFMMLLLLAGLQSQPNDAARGGAGWTARAPWSVFRRADAAAPAPVHRAGRGARDDLPGQHVRHRLHDDAGRPGHGQREPAVLHLPARVPRLRHRPVRRDGRRRRDRHDHRGDASRCACCSGASAARRS